jgi:hypothetical protein
MNRRASIAAFLCAALLTACNWYEKNAVQEISGPVPAGAQIKFFNFGVGAPAVNFYANDRKMTAIASGTGEESTLGVGYGGVGAGGLYTAIAAGQYTLAGKIAAATDKDLAISTASATLEDGKFYSFYMSGIYNTTTKTVQSFVLEDPFPSEFDYSVAYVRFVNAISNAAHPMILYAKGADSVEVAVGPAVVYQGAGAFTALAPGVYNLFARYVDSTANKITRPAVSFSAGRTYTIGARGNITVAPTTTCPATSTTCLDNTANR